MDLSQIKKNIESGVIRTTSEFQRDMMLMFTNAIMYNNCNHRVHKMAVEMYNDVLQHIEVYLCTQYNYFHREEVIFDITSAMRSNFPFLYCIYILRAIPS